MRCSKEDAKNSILFAQLAAGKSNDRTKEASVWLSTFIEMLGKVGWVAASPKFTQVDDPAQYGTVDKAVLSLLQNTLTAPQLQLFDSTVQSFKENEIANKIFDSLSQSTNSSDAATFLTGVVNPTSDGDIAVTTSYFNYQTSAEITTTFFNSLTGAQVSLLQGNQTMILNSNIYGTVRDVVRHKLEAVGSESYVVDL
ncbi:hypothetical protein HWV62_41068 [Athelia sp. TMB]|nr:hypothetical protein HWV62_41068 [Athelia sp. TMB]